MLSGRVWSNLHRCGYLHIMIFHLLSLSSSVVEVRRRVLPLHVALSISIEKSTFTNKTTIYSACDLMDPSNFGGGEVHPRLLSCRRTPFSLQLDGQREETPHPDPQNVHKSPLRGCRIVQWCFHPIYLCWVYLASL